jgi:ubiquinone/menaquinone biosynthesis C-methylase UbiE
VDVAEVKQRQRYAWGQGDYSRISEMLRPSAEALCAACGVTEGQHVLDVAAGDGNFALAAARAGARVVASDLSPEMVKRGRPRTEAEGYEVEWLEADAEDLPFEDDRFDCVGSVFGAMLAPRPEVAAGELFRVARPGGAIGMTAWTPESFSVRLFSIARKYQPPAPDLPQLEEWGEEETARRRFGDLPASLDFERRRLPWEAESIEDFNRFIESTPMATALAQVLSDEQLEALRAEQLELVRGELGGGEGPISLEAEYLMMVARKPGPP